MRELNEEISLLLPCAAISVPIYACMHNNTTSQVRSTSKVSTVYSWSLLLILNPLCQNNVYFALRLY